MVTDSNGYRRTGVVMVVWNDSGTEYTEWSTRDLGGPTSPITFTTDVAGQDVRLLATVSSGTWTVKTLTRIVF